MQKTLFALGLAGSVAAAPAPVAVFHGFGDECNFPGMYDIVQHMGTKMGTYVKCIEIGTDSFGSGSFNSIFLEMPKQGVEACNKIKADPHFQDEFSVMGLSQGGLLARYIAEECDTAKPVRNILTAGGPHMGVAKVPNCWSGLFCAMVNWVSEEFVYFKFIQDMIAPASYFRDPTALSDYMADSIFLPFINNEKSANPTYKKRLSEVQNAMFIMFGGDTVIYPRETAQFGELQSDYTTVKPVKETKLYTDDLIGLKELDERGALHFQTFPGEHLQFTMKQLDEVMIPFLSK